MALQSTLNNTGNNTEWEATFPNDFESEKGSTLFLGRLLYVFTAAVLKHREILPETAFKKRIVRDVPEYGVGIFHVLNRNDTAKMTERIGRLLKGCMEAISKHYLRTFSLVINENEADPDLVSEAFMVIFAYGKQDLFTVQDASGNSVAELFYDGPDTVKQQTLHLVDRIRSICLNMAKLPENRRPSFRLSYYDDRTPADYEPNGFYPNNKSFRIQHNCVRMSIDRVDTKLHSAMFELHSAYLKEDGSDDDFDKKVEETHLKLLSDRKVNANNTLLDITALTSIAGSEHGDQPDNEQDGEVERGSGSDSVIVIHDSPVRESEPIKLTEIETNADESRESDDLKTRKRKAEPTARKLKFEGPSPPKQVRVTRAQAKKQSLVEYSVESSTSSANVPETMYDERPLILRSPRVSRPVLVNEKHSGREFLVDTPE